MSESKSAIKKIIFIAVFLAAAGFLVWYFFVKTSSSVPLSDVEYQQKLLEAMSPPPGTETKIGISEETKTLLEKMNPPAEFLAPKTLDENDAPAVELISDDIQNILKTMNP